jgi:hypothetical protein
MSRTQISSITSAGATAEWIRLRNSLYAPAFCMHRRLRHGAAAEAQGEPAVRYDPRPTSARPQQSGVCVSAFVMFHIRENVPSPRFYPICRVKTITFRLSIAGKRLAQIYGPETQARPMLRRADKFDTGLLEGFFNVEKRRRPTSRNSVDLFESLYRWETNPSTLGQLLGRKTKREPRRANLSSSDHIDIFYDAYYISNDCPISGIG